jgi:two-component system KDP operon response regulator KdpE
MTPFLPTLIGVPGTRQLTLRRESKGSWLVGTTRERRSVLVCDNDLQTLRALRVVLGDAGLLVRVTQTAEDALARAALRVPDAAIIELALGDSNGTEVVRQLRECSSIPVIILSRVSDEDRIVEAFQAGADDYIIKPFKPRELVARVHAHLKRAAVGDDDPVILCGGVQIDLAARVVHAHGQEIRLTPIEYKLLCALARNRGRLLTHDALLRNVWGAAYAEDRQTLRAHIANLRRKLSAPRSTGPIRTYPGVGYLFEDPGNATARRQPSTTATATSLRAAPAA